MSDVQNSDLEKLVNGAISQLEAVILCLEAAGLTIAAAHTDMALQLCRDPQRQSLPPAPAASVLH